MAATASTPRKSQARNARPGVDRDPMQCVLVGDAHARLRTQRRPRWYPPRSSANAIQGFPHLLSRQRRQFLIWHSDYTFATFFQRHRRGGNFNFQAPVTGANFQRLPRLERQRQAQSLWDDNAPGRIDGNFHGLENAIKMADAQWQRLALTPSGLVRYALKTPCRDGTKHILLEPLDLMARLAALVPPPWIQLSRYHGVFAPHNRLRAAITPAGRGFSRRQRRFSLERCRRLSVGGCCRRSGGRREGYGDAGVGPDPRAAPFGSTCSPCGRGRTDCSVNSFCPAPGPTAIR